MYQILKNSNNKFVPSLCRGLLQQHAKVEADRALTPCPGTHFYLLCSHPTDQESTT